MPYRTKVAEKIRSAEATDGKRLGLEAMRLDFPVTQIARATGATRQTVYNWFVGKPIAPYYAERVTKMLQILKGADTAEKAWRETCLQFSIHA